MATRSDVASLAGVSTATVSRVMNNLDVVSPEIRERVLAAACKLDYIPNLIAKGLKTKKSYNIAYLIPDVTNPYYTEIYGGISEACSSSSYVCSLIETTQINWHEILLRQKFDGIISGTPLNDQLISILSTLGVPIVIQTGDDTVYEFPRSITVSHNLNEVFREAIRYILQKGHENVGLLLRDKTNNFMHSIYKDELECAGICYDTSFVCEFKKPDYHYIEGYELMKALLELHPEVTAVIAENDLYAIGAMSAASNAGYKIPDDISFLGCDDTVAAKFSIPPLSTIKRFKSKQGIKSAQILFEMIDNKEVLPYQFKSKFIIRGSIL